MVKIIPKLIPKPPLWKNIVFYFSLVLLLAVVASYFVLDHYQHKAQFTLENLRTALAKQTTPQQKELEKKIFSYQQKIKDFSILLTAHKTTSNFFQILEGSCHPQIRFLRLNLNPETYKAEISGQAKDFQTLGQQLLIYQKQPTIKNVTLSNMSTEKGKVGFSCLLDFDPQIFEFK